MLGLGGCEAPDTVHSAAAGTESVPEVRMRVRAGVAEFATLDFDQSFTGIVDPYREAMVASEIGGRVVTRHVEPGDKVKAGDPLLGLDISRLGIARDRASASLRARRVELSDATRNLERGQRLMETGAISDHELDRLSLLTEKARADLDMADAALRDANNNLADARISAPFGGRVEVVLAQVGDYLSQGQHVAKLVDFSKARVKVGVTAGEAASLAVGQPGRMGLEAVRTGETAGTIRSIGRSASDRGLFPVEIWVEGEAATGLRQGMVATVTLHLQADRKRLRVPSSAVFRREGVTQVFRIDASQRAHLVPVTTGLATGGSVQILEGLSAGDRVITEGQFALSQGALVEIIR